MRKPPCKKNGMPCSKRCPGCQDHCPDFKEYREGVAQDAEKKRQEQRVESTYYAGKARLHAEKNLTLGSIHKSRKMSVAECKRKHKGFRR